MELPLEPIDPIFKDGDVQPDDPKEDQKDENSKANENDKNEGEGEDAKDVKEPEPKSESEYEDVEDPEFDNFNSDDSTEKKRIVSVDYLWGGKGYLRKQCIKKKITIFVKTFYGDRKKQRFTVDINSQVGSLTGNFFKVTLLDMLEDSKEISSYHIIKFIYPMGRMRSISLTDSFAQQGIPDNACLVMIGKKDF